MEINLGEIIDVKLDLKDPDGFLKARVTWVFSSGTIIDGGRITISRYSRLWVQMPKFKLPNGKWIKPFKPSDSIYRQMSEKGLEKYYQLRPDSKLTIEKPEKDKNNEGEVDLGDIDDIEL